MSDTVTIPKADYERLLYAMQNDPATATMSASSNAKKIPRASMSSKVSHGL